MNSFDVFVIKRFTVPESGIYTGIMIVYGNLEYIRKSGIYTEFMIVYRNLDYIRASGIYTEIMIVYGNQAYKQNKE